MTRSTPSHNPQRSPVAASNGPAQAQEQGQEKPSRRQLLVGLGAAGAAGVAVTAVPLMHKAAPSAPAALAPAPEAGGGYQLTAHVKHYYQTAKV